MKRTVFATLLSVLLLAGITLVQPHAAFAVTTKPALQCVVAQVVLHDTQPATITCLRTADTLTTGQTVASSVTPNRYVACANSDLLVYQDANYGGAQLCIFGRGLLNLTSIPLGCVGFICWGNWNDTISSFTTGTRWGHYAWDINNGGAWYFFSPGEQVPYIGDVWNDQISSIEVDGP